MLENIKEQYLESEVVSGEFIFSLEFDKSESKAEIEESVQAFLDWDESPEDDWEVVDGGDKWLIK